MPSLALPALGTSRTVKRIRRLREFRNLQSNPP